MPVVDVVQLTPRRSFDVAKVFDKASQLGVLCTDIAFRNHLFGRVALPSRVSADRYAVDLKCGTLHCDYVAGLKLRYHLRFKPEHRKYEMQIAAAASLAKCYLRSVGLSNHVPDTVYCLDTAAKEVFESCSAKTKVLEQCVAPRQSQAKALSAYGEPSDCDLWRDHFRSLGERESREWELADLILAPSQFVFDELRSYGVPTHKIRVLPYWTPFKPLSTLPVRTSSKMKVLFVGNDARRKGLEDLFRVAKVLRRIDNIVFQVAGSVSEEFDAYSSRYGNSNVEYLGVLPHPALKNKLIEAGAFFLPSYLEGSSVATYEAMSFGLPVVTTKQTGSVVQHSFNGFEFEAGDVDGFVGAIGRLASDDEYRNTIASNSLNSIRDFQFANYEAALRDVVNEKNVEANL
ncbi:glycosyltransferase family 4 protein [Rhodopirellula halodulae]|uniref:glycosyltransferase family 4 protein n=1 Tax=Rhodopirellula halodulae TaxID=2894198 RepID=UPI001E64B9D0|nr:glycosyltransferase family 4 protein [Rhodopirellula sp. JC737]MCC9656092.1 glycosyltransferase family 4 protein [Rhodopirellula sp. JC737]